MHHDLHKEVSFFSLFLKWLGYYTYCLCLTPPQFLCIRSHFQMSKNVDVRYPFVIIVTRALDQNLYIWHNGHFYQEMGQHFKKRLLICDVIGRFSWHHCFFMWHQTKFLLIPHLKILYKVAAQQQPRMQILSTGHVVTT
jgi:hypothetical protein